MDRIRKHIADFPAQEDHYSLSKNSQRQYLDSDLSIRKLCDLFIEDNPFLDACETTREDAIVKCSKCVEIFYKDYLQISQKRCLREIFLYVSDKDKAKDENSSGSLAEAVSAHNEHNEEAEQFYRCLKEFQNVSKEIR